MTDTPTPDLSPAALEALIERLEGKYRIPITDGLGPAGGEEPDNADFFVRSFPSSPLAREAAATLRALAPLARIGLAVVKAKPETEARAVLAALAKEGGDE